MFAWNCPPFRKLFSCFISTLTKGLDQMLKNQMALQFLQHLYDYSLTGVNCIFLTLAERQRDDDNLITACGVLVAGDLFLNVVQG